MLIITNRKGSVCVYVCACVLLSVYVSVSIPVWMLVWSKGVLKPINWFLEFILMNAEFCKISFSIYWSYVFFLLYPINVVNYIILNVKTALHFRNNMYFKTFQQKTFKTQCTNKEIPLNIHKRKNENLTQKIFHRLENVSYFQIHSMRQSKPWF